MVDTENDEFAARAAAENAEIEAKWRRRVRWSWFALFVNASFVAKNLALDEAGWLIAMSAACCGLMIGTIMDSKISVKKDKLLAQGLRMLKANRKMFVNAAIQHGRLQSELKYWKEKAMGDDENRSSEASQSLRDTHA